MSRPLFPLEGSVCLVTGASSGIGRATAGLLAKAGARLVLQGRNEEGLRQAAEETGGDYLAVDLAVPGAADYLFTAAKRLQGRIDVVVNNAGAGWAGPFAEMPPELIPSLVTLNLLAPMTLARAALPDMMSSGRGRIVFVASIAGYLGVKGEAVYSASKASLLALAESLRAETAGSGIAVSVVSPSVIETPFFSRRGSPYARSWPRPLPAETAARAICRAIQRGRPETIVPSSMGLAVRVRVLAPSLYRALADRYA